ncbi:hypothetical protein ACSBR2_005599 [Camellia fascicularis]
MPHSYESGFSLMHDKQQGSVYITWHIENTSDVHFMFLTPDGTLQVMYGNEQVKNPYVTWMAPLHRCDIYGVCGPFAVCNNNKSPNCECLKGLASSGKAQNDGFWKLSSMKLPDHYEYLRINDSSGCQRWCLSNCSCEAYAYVTGIDCMVWSGGLMDIQQFPLAAGNGLFLRLSYIRGCCLGRWVWWVRG